MFAKMLEHVAYHYENLSSQALSDFIVGLVERPLPKPGETFEVNLQVQNELRKWRFTRPNEEDSFLEHVCIYSIYTFYLNFIYFYCFVILG